jgi:S1-C subfamily serine protease
MLSSTQEEHMALPNELSEALAAAVDRAGRSIVTVNARQRFPSTGVVWRDGVVVTAAHTVKRDEEITISLADGTSRPATLGGRDRGTDLAVLKVDTSGLAAVETVASDSLKVGHLVLAVWGTGGGSASASLGIVGGLGGPWRTWRGGMVDRFIRPDVGLFPGFSGGALVDVDGNAVGINTTGLSRGTGLTLAAETVDRVVGELVARGRIARGFLGVGMQQVRLPDAIVAAAGIDGDTGVMVLGVEPDGPADRAGLFIGDILVALDGERIRDTEDVQAALGGDRVGAELRATVIRAGAPADLTITVGEWPSGR